MPGPTFIKLLQLDGVYAPPSEEDELIKRIAA